MPEYSLETLLQFYFDNQLTKEQEQELFALISAGTHDEEIKLFMDRSWSRLAAHYTLPDTDKDIILRSIFHRPIRRVPLFKRAWFRYAAAAVLLFVVCSLWFVVDRRGGEKPVVVQTPVDIAPGREGAVLTLTDGSRMILDSMANGIVAKQNGNDVELNNGELKYRRSDVRSLRSELKYNVLTTPRGRQFQLMLPDGSKVWLNAASSITYPVAFTGEQRQVTITGEAYFEVAKDAKRAFVVACNNMAVTVLGTHFNINAYADEESIKTTLLEGKVKVSATQPQTTNHKLQTVLSPGQQAELKAQQLTKTNNVDVNRAVAWKNGAFDFSGQDFAASMRQLERWYDVKVVYDGPAPAGRLGGKIGRDLTLMQVVKLLDGVVATFRLQNKELHVSQ